MVPVALIAAALAAAPAPAPTDAQAKIVQAISAQRLGLARSSDGSFSGAGWQRIVDDAAGAQFMMVGEQHGSGSIAEFETALHKELAQRGYTHAGLEIGPVSTRFAERLVRRGPGQLSRYVAAPGHGFALPFLFFGEEIAMAEQMVATSPDRTAALWGLDQEFVGAGPLHADLFEAEARTPAQKAAVAAFRKAAEADGFYSGKVTDAQLAPLRRAFAGNRAATGLLDELSASSAIYAPFLKGPGSGIYAANLARETMMKRNFLAAFTAAERRRGSPPKVFLKFGGNHAMRGHSGTDVPALGNFLAEWGTARGMRMVNLFVECDGGEAMNPQTGKPGLCEPYFGADSLLRQAVATGPALQLYDLRPLRAKLPGWKALDPATRQVILAFDYYVTIRNGRAATPVGTPAASQ